MCGYSVVKIVDSEDEFVNYICKINPGAKYVEFVTYDELETENKYGAGEYLLKIGNKITMVEKSITEGNGWYVFNSVITTTKQINEWTLCNYDVDNETNNDSQDLSSNRLNIGIIQPKYFNMDKHLTTLPKIIHVGKRGTEYAEQSVKIVKHYIKRGDLKESNLYTFNYDDIWKDTFKKANVCDMANVYDASRKQTYVADKIRALMSNQSRSKNSETIFLVINARTLINCGKAVLEDLLMGSKSKNIGVIVNAQYCVGISPEFRCQFDFVFLHEEHSFSNKKRMHEHYAGMFASSTQFNNYLNLYTKNLNSFVICNRPGNDVVNKLYTFSA